MIVYESFTLSRMEVPMARSVATFLMFEGVAEQAMNLYTSLFKDAEINLLERHGPGEQGVEGSVKRAEFTLSQHSLMFFDSSVKHAFTFTPSISLFVECESETELDEAFQQLSSGGAVLMPLDNYGFSRKFGWVNDRFGVSLRIALYYSSLYIVLSSHRPIQGLYKGSAGGGKRRVFLHWIANGQPYFI
jgi:predicted 3-demethylubiquinone-9 3-methyltransferase (glyoxalase superfamily)